MTVAMLVMFGWTLTVMRGCGPRLVLGRMPGSCLVLKGRLVTLGRLVLMV